jgi:LPXTG-motif cell wall-anchored protein
MNKARLSWGIVLILIGAVWVLQGLDSGLVPQSAMTGQTTWVVLGSLAVLIGLGLIWWRRRPNEPKDLPDKEQ